MIEEKVYGILSSLCDGRVYPLIAPLGVKPAYLIYTVVSEHYDDMLKGQGVLTSNVQIDCYACSLIAAKQIINQVIELFAILHPVQLLLTQDYESDTELYCSTLELTIRQ